MALLLLQSAKREKKKHSMGIAFGTRPLVARPVGLAYLAGGSYGAHVRLATSPQNLT